MYAALLVKAQAILAGSRYRDVGGAVWDRCIARRRNSAPGGGRSTDVPLRILSGRPASHNMSRLCKGRTTYFQRRSRPVNRLKGRLTAGLGVSTERSIASPTFGWRAASRARAPSTSAPRHAEAVPHSEKRLSPLPPGWRQRAGPAPRATGKKDTQEG